MEEYQNKLVQLQEHQASLAGMQIHVREKLNEARQAQQMLLQQEDQNSIAWESNRASLPGPANIEQFESQTEALRGKLAQLQTKKKQMDHLVAELQAIEASERGSCVSSHLNLSSDQEFLITIEITAWNFVICYLLFVILLCLFYINSIEF